MTKFVLVLALAGVSGCAADISGVPAGVPNFHQVDDHLYRGAQPTEEGFKNLAKLGVKTVIDLREARESKLDEQAMVTGAGMHFIHYGMNGSHAPSNGQIAELLAMIDRQPGPVFIHCRRGADRTGTVVATYRIARQNWPNAKALLEARHNGMGFTEFTMQYFIMHFHPAAVGVPARATPVASTHN